MTDLVKRLRETKEWVAFPAVPICVEAADEIERLRDYHERERYLRADIAKLRAEIEGLKFELKAAQEEIKIADGVIERLRAERNSDAP
jgi:chromosome segregation ATPase